jgi:hypothetical protein
VPRAPTRFLGMGAVDNAAKSKWVYAFSITPQSALDAAAVTAAPPGATPSPYAGASASLPGQRGAGLF